LRGQRGDTQTGGSNIPLHCFMCSAVLYVLQVAFCMYDVMYGVGVGHMLPGEVHMSSAIVARGAIEVQLRLLCMLDSLMEPYTGSGGCTHLRHRDTWWPLCVGCLFCALPIDLVLPCHHA
jgi:hypothetical protein